MTDMLLGKLLSKATRWCVRMRVEHPLIVKMLRRVWHSAITRFIWNKLWNFEIELRTLLANGESIFTNYYLINPERIKYDALDIFVPLDHIGTILHGDWDKPKNRAKFDTNYVIPRTEYRRYHNIMVYRMLYDRFVNRKNWEDTDFYNFALEEIKKGKPVSGLPPAKTKEEIDKYCAFLDSLYETIKKNGYKSQRELKNGFYWDEVSVLISREGKYLFNNGIHRLSIAKILRISKIPVVVAARHPEWVKFKRKILARRNEMGLLYQKITHPDLADIPAIYGDERWELIRKNLRTKSGNMLDIGAHWGYFCHKFEELGFNCYAVETDPDNLYFLRKLKNAENKKFVIIDRSIFDFINEKNCFDVTLALNIFHWFVETKDFHDKFITLLQKLETSELFIQIPKKVSESDIKRPYKDYTADEFVDLILENMSLTHAKLLGEVNNRPLYQLY